MIFYRQNKPFPVEAKEILFDPEFYTQYETPDPTQPKYSSFFNWQATDQEHRLNDILNSFYKEIVDEVMKNLGYKDQYVNKYNFYWWWQVYVPQSPGFMEHNHLGSQISFNHFIKPTESSFVFKNNKYQLVEETQDDIIFWPGFAYHKVLPNQTQDIRITVSGNIDIDPVESTGYKPN